MSLKQKLPRKFGHGALIIVLLPLIIPLALIGIVLFLANRLVLNALVWVWWMPRRRNILFVYSDSPIWKEYMTGQILPLVEHRAAVLNWSERNRWSRWSLAVRLFHSYSGGRDFNPMVIVFRPMRRAEFFRFLPAFQEWKRGNHAPVEQLRKDMMAQL